MHGQQNINKYRLQVYAFFFRDTTALRAPMPRQASRSHSDTPQPVGLLWKSDQLVAEITS